MSNPWPKSLRDACDKWDNTSEELPPVGTRCRLVLEEHEDIASEHLERNGKEVEIIAHICNGNLAVCVCYEHWARNDVGEWWVAAFNSAAFEQIDEPFWPGATGDDQLRSRCKVCGIDFARPRQADVPDGYCTRCWASAEAFSAEQDALADAWDAGEERIERIAQSDASGDHYEADELGYVGRESRELDEAMKHGMAMGLRMGKQARYQDATGDDWIDEFARTATPEEFRGAMRFTVGKYLRRIGKKDSELSEVRKMRDYCQRWEAYLQGGDE